MLRRALLVSLCLHFGLLLWRFPLLGGGRETSGSYLQASVRVLSPELLPRAPAGVERSPGSGLRKQRTASRRGAAGAAGAGNTSATATDEGLSGISAEEVTAYRLRLGQELRRLRAEMPVIQAWPAGRLIVRIEPAFPERLQLIHGQPASARGMQELIARALRTVETPASLRHAMIELVFESGEE